MRLLDGEALESHLADLQLHVARCGECQRTMARFEAASVTFHKEALFPELQAKPRSSGMKSKSFRILPFRPSAYSGDALTSRKSRPSVWAAGIAVCLSGALLWHLLVTPVGVSAHELIERARVEESRRPDSKEVRRSVRTSKRVAGSTKAQSEHLDLRNGNTTRLSGGNPSLTDEIRQALAHTKCGSYSVLSASMMKCLADMPGVNSRVVSPNTKVAGETYELAMDVLQPEAGEPFSCTWTLRLADWHLVRAEFRFFGFHEDVEYTVEELSRSLTPLSTVSVPKRRPQSPSSAEISAPLGHMTVEKQPGDLRDDYRRRLAVLRKLAVLEALRLPELNPDDAVEILWDDNGRTRLRAMVDDTAQKHALSARLSAIEGVTAEIMTLDDLQPMVAPGNAETGSLEISMTGPLPGHAATNTLATPRTFQSEGALLLDKLSEKWGGGDEGRKKALQHGQTVLNRTLDLSYRAKWLARVTEAFSKTDQQMLREQDMDRLRNLESQLLQDLRLRHRNLQAYVATLLCTADCTPAATALIPEGRTHFDSVDPAQLLKALDDEFTLLRVLFVDRDYGSTHELALSGDDRGQDPGQDLGMAATRWQTSTQLVSDALHPQSAEQATRLQHAH